MNEEQNKITVSTDLDSMLDAVKNDHFDLQEDIKKKIFESLETIVANEPDNAKAIGGLGQCYYIGIGVERDQDIAFDYFEKAGNLGDCFSCSQLGSHYFMISRLMGQEEYYELAFSWLLKASQLGDSASKWWLSKLYNSGCGVEENEEESFRWITSAAIDGFTAAFSDLAKHYVRGWGTPKNMEKAFYWYLRSANECKNKEAMYMVGIFYRNGIGVRQDPHEAIKWLQKAVDEGVNRAKIELAKMYFVDRLYKDTEFVPDYAKAEALLTDIINNSDDDTEINDALEICGYLYKAMGNYEQAFSIWERAAQNNVVEAYYQLGIAYYDGLGVAKSKSAAIMWLKKANAAGHEDALVALQKINADADTKKSGGCYIATAVYGSYDCPEVWTLRRYRDFTLAKTKLGRIFIKTYYSISPTLVKWFGGSSWFVGIFRRVLDRLIKKLKTKGVEDTPYQDKQY